MAPGMYHPLIAKLAQRSVARFPCQHRGRPADRVCVQADAASRAAKPRKRAAGSFMITQTISARSRGWLTMATTVSAAHAIVRVLCAHDTAVRAGFALEAMNSSSTPATAAAGARTARGGPRDRRLAVACVCASLCLGGRGHRARRPQRWGRAGTAWPRGPRCRGWSARRLSPRGDRGFAGGGKVVAPDWASRSPTMMEQDTSRQAGKATAGCSAGSD